ncbi:MAG: hypothetical protein LBN42_03040 [Oscillospiraceae bacterium]|jgi:hypothetical protein|nr:hypothetical protein [Oscillospiraceae bacterium]
MASTIDMKTAGFEFYSALLYELELAKYKDPDGYLSVSKVANNLRTHISNVYGIDNLPPVPMKDEK